ncbi:MAG: hypothetical protein KGH57_02630 [Candidatus Micrarchaeota archaeon]|nr:hypothetical protein [Candidatus Micrarchaeota archaeon]
MPYIKKNDRPEIDALLQPLIGHLKTQKTEEVDGQINYIMSRLLKDVYPAKYFSYNRAMGVLESVKQEFYRRYVAPYEEGKIKENGDID